STCDCDSVAAGALIRAPESICTHSTPDAIPPSRMSAVGSRAYATPSTMRSSIVPPPLPLNWSKAGTLNTRSASPLVRSTTPVPAISNAPLADAPFPSPVTVTEIAVCAVRAERVIDADLTSAARNAGRWTTGGLDVGGVGVVHGLGAAAFGAPD